VVIGVEILDLAGELGLELRSVKVGDGSGSALSGYGVEPGGFNIVAYRG